MKTPTFPAALTPAQQALAQEAQLHTALTGRPHPLAHAVLVQQLAAMDPAERAALLAKLAQANAQ